MARATGLEPATPGVTGRYSNRLSYARAVSSKPLRYRFSKAGVIDSSPQRVKRSSQLRCRKTVMNR
jgi:hypothetical protein